MMTDRIPSGADFKCTSNSLTAYVSEDINYEKTKSIEKHKGDVFVTLFGVMGFIIASIIALIIVLKKKKMTPEEYQKLRNDLKAKNYLQSWGNINPALICPHCQTKGFVRTVPVKRKKGISGAKATGALLTLGVSMLATGLSRKETVTQAYCENCRSTWDF